jgi:4-hydroxythreonine-4-phosphate dehydrogenase
MDKPKETSKDTPIRVGISIGDINGIGPEVVIKALNDAQILLDCTPVIYASSKSVNFHKKRVFAGDFNYVAVSSADEIKPRKINVVNVWEEEVAIELGKITETGGSYALKSLDHATKDLAAGKVDVLVTAPISKEAMAKAGFKFPGHTEYLADMAGEAEALMLMVAGNLRVGLVTTHMALKDVPGAMTIEKIHGKIRAFEQSLRKDFGIRRPKIAVLGLNPHAGENGKMGNEENEVIKPSISKATNEGIMAFGPYPADSFFGSSNRFNFDGVLAMFHDQGLSAFKAIAFDEGVNYTAGLPVVRTSPDHGTAFDIAGKDEASGASMRHAIYLAMDVYRNHQMEKEINANPLENAPEREREGKSRGGRDRDGDRNGGRRNDNRDNRGGSGNRNERSNESREAKKPEPQSKPAEEQPKAVEEKPLETKVAAPAPEKEAVKVDTPKVEKADPVIEKKEAPKQEEAPAKVEAKEAEAPKPDEKKVTRPKEEKKETPKEQPAAEKQVKEEKEGE